jgi:integrase
MAAKRSYGSGSLHVVTATDGSEVWTAKWRIDGKQVKRRIGPKRTPGRSDGLTRAQAEATLRDLMRDVTAEALGEQRKTSSGHMTILDLWEVFQVDGRRRGLKETTMEDYGSAVRQHLVPHFGVKPIGKITRRDVAALVDKLDRAKLRPKSIHNYVRVLSSLLALAERRELIPATPARDVELPALMRDDGTVEEPLRFLEVYEVADLASAAGAAEGPYAPLDRAMLLMAALTGLRQGELRGLKWGQVDFAASRVRVIEGYVRGRRTTPKSHKPRSVPMAQTVRLALEDWHRLSQWTKPTDNVFADPITGEPLARTGMMSRYRKALKAAGLAESFRYHDLRHTFGTSMARAGEPVTTIQAWMGHADLKTTQRYMHYAPAADEAARIEAAFGAADPRIGTAGTNWTAGQPI